MNKAKIVISEGKARASANMIKLNDAAHAEHHEKCKKDSVSVDPEPESGTSNISPKDFDAFIPWVCRFWSTTHIPVYIVRKAQDQYENVNEKSITKVKKTKPKDDLSIEYIDESSSTFNKAFTDDSTFVLVTAYYDAHGKLVEISIDRSPVRLPRHVIRAFSLALPYHSSLRRFTFRRSGLTAELICDIKKLLPISNICEIILDDSEYVPEGNYHILLEQFSQLKYLSLNRCKVNDEVCKKIFNNIRFDAPAANTLQILELGSNEITDHGADFIASVLRTNRCLVHLNLSGNRITDNGFLKILDILMEFPLNTEERCASRLRELRYLQSKTAVYARCLDEIKCGNLEAVTDASSPASKSGKKMLIKRLRTKTKKTEPMRTIEDEGEMMATKIVGEFNDPFSAKNVVVKDTTAFCKGNFVLCSINIAYNNLEYPSVRKLSEVLQYQEGLREVDGKDTGLIRITLDGNRIPRNCSELNDIGLYLQKVVQSRMKSEFKKRANTLSRTKSASHRSRAHSKSQLGI